MNMVQVALGQAMTPTDRTLWFDAIGLGWDSTPFEIGDSAVHDGWQASAHRHIDDALGPRLPAQGAMRLWREWYQANASHWDAVGDIEAELGR